MEGFTKDFILYNPDRYESVVVTGSWCNWSEQGHKLTKIPGLYWIATVILPYDTKVSYKYIINGTWQTNPDDELETDSAGNTNNVFRVPKAEVLSGSLVGATGSTKDEPILASSTSAGSLRHLASEPATSSSPVATTSATTQSTSSSKNDDDRAAGHAVADSGIAADAARAASLAGLGQDEHHSSLATAAGPAATTAGGLNHVPTGGSVAEAGIAEEAAKAAQKHNLNHVPTGGNVAEHGVAADAAKAAQQHNLNHVPTGGNVAEHGVAADAAKAAQQQGLGQNSESSGDSVTGVKKVAPGVVEAVPSSQGQSVSDNTLAKPEGLSISSSSKGKAPLPASTGDAPLSPESAAHAEEGKGLFGVLGGLGAAAVGVATAAATNIAHRVTGDDAEGPHTATQTPATSLGQSTSDSRDPAAALQPIASNDVTARISKDLAAVDLEHTKQEVVHAVEKFGQTIAGSLSGLGAAVQPDVQHVASKTGGLSMATPTGSAANTPGIPGAKLANYESDSQAYASATVPPSSSSAITGAPASSIPVAAGVGGATMNNIAGSVGSSGTKRETSPSAAGTGVNVAGLGLNSKDGGPSPSEGATVVATTAGTSSSVNVPGLAVNSTNSGSSAKASAPVNVAGLSVNGSSPSSGASTSTTPAAAPKSATQQTSSAPAPIAKDTSSTTPAASSVPGISGSEPTPAAASVPVKQTGDSAGPTTTTTPKSTVSKKDTSALGVGQPGASAQPPVTPKKNNIASSANTPATEGYKTAPSTPASQAGTPADRKRKSSIFHKIKSALSPSK